MIEQILFFILTLLLFMCSVFFGWSAWSLPNKEASYMLLFFSLIATCLSLIVGNKILGPYL